MFQGHSPQVLDTFNGLWDRDDDYNVPSDHFRDCENIISRGLRGFGSRDGIDKHQNVVAPLGKVVRIYNYPTQTANTLIALTWDGTDGKIYHVVDSVTVFGPILTKAGMEDFAFVPYAGRAYISPFRSYVVADLKQEKGLQNEFLYVYLGDGTAARKAAGIGLSGTITVANGSSGHTDAGFHLFGFIIETDTGYLGPPEAIAGFTTDATHSVSFSNVPISANANVVKRHLVATKVIQNYNGDTLGYTFYRVPGASINNNVGTTLSDISFYDADLLEDVSHLSDNYTEIPAGVGLSFYHNRLVLYTTYNDISIALISAPGEPEAISQISGLIIAPLDGNPITNIKEMRDVMYVFKRSRTLAYVDNDDVPSSWPMTVIDNALGASVHGIATVIDSGSASVDSLIVANYKGINIFNGGFVAPELSWKIQNLWNKQDRVNFRLVSMMNDPVNQFLYITLTDYRLMIADYKNGMSPKTIKWWPQRFEMRVNAIALVNIDDVVLAAEGAMP